MCESNKMFCNLHTYNSGEIVEEKLRRLLRNRVSEYVLWITIPYTWQVSYTHEYSAIWLPEQNREGGIPLWPHPHVKKYSWSMTIVKELKSPLGKSVHSGSLIASGWLWTYEYMSKPTYILGKYMYTHIHTQAIHIDVQIHTHICNNSH